MTFRLLSNTGRGVFASLACSDLLLALWALMAESGLSAALVTGDVSAVSFTALWGLRMLWWTRNFVGARNTHIIGPWAAMGAVMILTLALQTGWSSAPTALAAYALYPVSLLFYTIYPATWATPRPEVALARRETLTATDCRRASVFADGVGAVTTPYYANPKLQPSAGHFDERSWVQEFGDPTHPVLIMLPGMPVSPESLASVISGFLLQRYFVVLIEFPGTGNGRGQAFTLEALTQRVDLYISELQPNPAEPVLLYGVSGGGNAALYLAARMPTRISAVTAVVAVAPGNTTFSFRADRSVFWHPLMLKTKVDARITPTSLVKRFITSQLRAIAQQLPNTDPLWHDNLQVVGDPAGAPAADASANDYFHHAGTFRADWFSPDGPGGSPDYVSSLTAVRDRVLDRTSDSNGFDAIYAPEVYPEYVDEYCRHDLAGQIGHIECPALFVGGVGDVASRAYDSWAEYLPDEVAHEVVMAKVVDAGLGGAAAHSHAGTFWRRHVLTVDRFFRAHAV